jgi:hypothetical protein
MPTWLAVWHAGWHAARSSINHACTSMRVSWWAASVSCSWQWICSMFGARGRGQRRCGNSTLVPRKQSRKVLSNIALQQAYGLCTAIVLPDLMQHLVNRSCKCTHAKPTLANATLLRGPQAKLLAELSEIFAVAHRPRSLQPRARISWGSYGSQAGACSAMAQRSAQAAKVAVHVASKY